jgi:hypothetical protein
MFNITKRSTPRRKLVNTAAVTLALAGGGVAGAVVGAPLISAAQEDDTPTTTEDTTEDTTPPADTTDDTTGDDEAPARDNGDSTGESDDEDCGPRIHGPGPGFGAGTKLETIAESLGIEREELLDALQDGQTVAEIAEANDVSTATLIDDLVADAEARIDEEVAEGDLDADEAEELKSDVRERITDFVNGELPDFGELRPPELRGRVFDHGRWDGDVDEPEDTESGDAEDD